MVYSCGYFFLLRISRTLGIDIGGDGNYINGKVGDSVLRDLGFDLTLIL